MKRYSFITRFALIVFCVLIAGCTDEVPNKFTESDIPAPPPLKVVSTSVKDNQEVNPDHDITITFNNIMDSVNIEITGIKGNTTLDTTNTSATFKPFDKIPNGIYTIKVTGKDEYGQELQPKTITFVVNSGSVTPSSSLIAYTSNFDGDYEIYLIRPDGTGLTQLTYNYAQDFQPAWSPNGKYLAYSSDLNGLYMWNSDIFIMRSDGSAQVNMTNTSGINESNPTWSLDSREIAFITDLDGTPAWYVMDIDSTNSRPWNSSDEANFTIPWVFGNSELKVDNPGGNYEIFIQPFGGGNRINLTNNLANDTWPVWSADGRKIVFVSDRDFNKELYIMDANGSNQRRLTYNFSDTDQPSWSPF